MDHTAIEAAALLGIKPDSVRTLIRRKLLKATKRAGAFFISQDEIDRYNRERHPRGVRPGSAWSEETRRIHAERHKRPR